MTRFYDAKQLNLREGHVKQIGFFDKKKKAKQRLVQTSTVEYSFSPRCTLIKDGAREGKISMIILAYGR